MINGYLGDYRLPLRQGTMVGTTLIIAPSSTTNKAGKRDPEMHQTKKGSQRGAGACDVENAGCGRLRTTTGVKLTMNLGVF